jgi:amino acid adenylation domain-containing protein
VAIVLPKGWEQYVGVWATIVAGGAYLPIAPEVPAERLRFLLDDGQVELALTTPTLAASLSWPDGVQVVEVTAPEPGTGPGVADELPAFPAPPQGPDDLAYVIYTSGSTGRPKGVMVAHRGVVNHVTDVIRRMEVGPDDRALATASLQHDLSVFDTFGVLAAGGTVVVPPPSASPDPDTWAELILREGVTFWAAVPAIADVLVTRVESRDVPSLVSLSRVVLAGDWIPLTLPDRLRALAPRAQVFSCGGPTETINLSIVQPIGEVDPSWASIPYGRPMANQRYHILDEDLRPRPVWVPGQMWVGSEIGLARGYWNDPERTAERFRTLPATGERIFATGDVGRYLPDGTIEILGRDDFQVKINGHRIELGEVESVARGHRDVAAAVAVAAGNGRGRRLVLFVAPAPYGTPPDPAAVRAHLADRLPGPLVPADVRALDALPITRNGKVDRGALTEWAEQRESNAPAAHGTPFEELVAQLYAEVLDLPACEVGTNFFQAGGDSVTGVRLAVRLEELLGVPIPVRTVLLATTPVALARGLADDPQIGPTVGAVASVLAELDESDIRAAISGSPQPTQEGPPC